MDSLTAESSSSHFVPGLPLRGEERKKETNFYYWNCWAGSEPSWCPGDIWGAVNFFVVFKYDFEAARFSAKHLLLILAAECFMTRSCPAWILNKRSIGCLRYRAAFSWLTHYLSITTTTPDPFPSTPCFQFRTFFHGCPFKSFNHSVIIFLMYTPIYQSLNWPAIVLVINIIITRVQSVERKRWVCEKLVFLAPSKFSSQE